MYIHDMAMRVSGSYATRFIFLTYSIFIIGFFLIPNAVDQYKFYSIAVFIPGLLLLPQGFTLLRNNRLFLLLVAYFIYMLINTAWSELFELKPFLIYARLVFYILMFLLVTAILRFEYPDKFDYFLQITCLVAGVAAIASMIIWYQDHSFPKSRLIGIGTLENPNPSAMVYGFFAILCLSYALSARMWQIRMVFYAAALVLLSFVWFTQSRGVLIATIAAVIILFALGNYKKTLLVMVAIAGTFGVLYLGFPELIMSAINRGLSTRPEIWSVVLQKVAEAPLFGHGYLTDEFVFIAQKKIYLFSHNAYIGALRDGGIIGLVFFLAMLVYAIWLSVRIGKKTGDYVYLALLVFGMTIMIFDTDRLVTRPLVLWIILWLPLSLIISHDFIRGSLKKGSHEFGQ